MSTFIYITLLILISFYALFASIQVGESLVLLLPKLSSSHDKKYRYTSKWEINNLVLLVAILLTLISFNRAHFSNIITVPFIFAAIGFVVRVITGVNMASKGGRMSHRNKLVLTVGSYLLPLSVSVIGIDFFTGKSVWSSTTGVVLLFSVLLGMSLIGLAFANRHNVTVNQRLRYFFYVLYGLWAIDLGFLLPHSLMRFNENLLRTPLTILIAALAVSTISFFLYSAIKNKVNELHQYVILVGLAAPILLGLDLQPFLINNKVTVQGAYSLANHQATAALMAIIALVVMLICFYIQSEQFVKSKKKLILNIFGR